MAAPSIGVVKVKVERRTAMRARGMSDTTGQPVMGHSIKDIGTEGEGAQKQK